jgi:CubicO group peptidase (beta-lactamase class C family)
MWRPVATVSPDSAGRSRVEMGLSFFIHQLDGRRILGHTGSQAGFRSFMYFDPERKTAIVWSFNTANRNAEQPAGWASGALVAAGLRALR